MKPIKILFPVLFTTLTSCATTSVSLKQEVPAEVDLPQSRTIVVQTFTGTRAQPLAQKFEEELARLKFSVISSRAHEREVRRGNQDPKGYVMVTGAIANNDGSKQVYTSKIDCNVNGRKFEALEKRIVARHDIQMMVMFVDPITGRQIYSKELTSTKKESLKWGGCWFTQPLNQTIDTYKVSQQAEADIVKQFGKIVAPWNKEIRVALFKDGDLPALAKGNEHFANQRLEEAEMVYEKAVARAEQINDSELLAHAYFNLGITRGYLGKKGARELIGKAYEINDEDDYLEQSKIMEEYYEYNQLRRRLGH